MKENKDKDLEKLVDKLMQHEKRESPTTDFTSHVMQRIENLQVSEITAYKPLISKPVWGVIGLCVLGVMAFLIFGTSANENTWMPEIDMGILYNNSITKTLSNFKFSNTAMYAVVMFAVMLGIQIPLLKQYYEKRMEI